MYSKALSNESIMLRFTKISCSAIISLLRIAKDWKTKDGKYIYERVRYGTRRSLSKASICIYMALHLFDIDQKGFCISGSISALKAVTGLSRKTIKRSLGALAEEGYINGGIIPSHGNTFSFQIIDYDKIYLRGDKGGTGYINVSLEMVKDLATYKDINQLRLILRAYIVLDNPKNRSQEYLITFDQIRSWFPTYVSTNQINNQIIEANKRASILCFKTDNEQYTTTAINKGKVRHHIDEAILENKRCIDNKIESMHQEYDKLFKIADEYNNRYGHYPSWIKIANSELKKINRSRICTLKIDERLHLARLAAKYGLEIVLNAIQYLYDCITLNYDYVEKPVAYITTLIKRHPNGVFADVGW